MNNENLRPISVNEYLTKNCQIKTVELPSGTSFKIRKITGRDYLREGGVNLQNVQTIARQSKEKDEALYEKMTAEEKKISLEINNKLMVLAVIEPQLSLKEEPNKICVDKLTDKDYKNLLLEITNFSFKEGVDLKPFRNEPEGTAS